MMGRLAVDPIAVTLAAGCLLAGALVAHQLRTPPFEPRAPLSGETPSAEVAAAPGWTMPPAEAFATVLDRPLFSESRRPPRPAIAEGPLDSGVDELSVAASAIIITPERRMALVRQGAEAPLLLTEGGRIDGWRLLEVGAEHLVFAAGSRRQRVMLQDMPAEAAPETALTAGTRAIPAPEVEATTVTLDGRELEILPEHADNRGEGSLLAAVPLPDQESATP